MREPLKDNIRFEHMLEAIDNVAQFTAGETVGLNSIQKERGFYTAYNGTLVSCSCSMYGSME